MKLCQAFTNSHPFFVTIFTGAIAISISEAIYGSGIDFNTFDTVTCTGTEQRLVDCVNSGFDSSQCTLYDIAGVICQPSTGMLDTDAY